VARGGPVKKPNGMWRSEPAVWRLPVWLQMRANVKQRKRVIVTLPWAEEWPCLLRSRFSSRAGSQAWPQAEARTTMPFPCRSGGTLRKRPFHTPGSPPTEVAMSFGV
jgi:hypothetical protein